MGLARKARFFEGVRRAIGLAATLDVVTRRMLKRRGAVRASVSGFDCAIEIDPLDSDMFLVAQVFGFREYGLDEIVLDRLTTAAADLRRVGRTPVIIDGGANVGYAALYFAALFPDALVVALEPVDGTFAALVRNCGAHPRIMTIRAALWSHDDGVALEAADDHSWGHRVAPAGQATPSTTLHGLFAAHPDWAPLIVKLDIEGAERTVAEASPDIFQAASCIMIEPHDYVYRGRACLTPLYRALADRPMDTLINGENLILIDPALTRPA